MSETYRADRNAGVCQLYTATGGGAHITLDHTGRVRVLQRDDVTPPDGIPWTAAESGLSIALRDSHGGIDSSVIASTGALIRQHATMTNEQLKIAATYEFLPDGALLVDGTIEDLSGSDRVADVLFNLPIAAIGGWWQQSIASEVRIRPDGPNQSQTDLPQAAVIGPEHSFGVAAAIPPDRPQRFEITYDPHSGMVIRLKFGLSPHAGSRAAYSFLIDLVDARWGLRSALERYYARYPEWFANRVHRNGFWMRGTAADYSSFRPDVYAFHEAGGDKGTATTVEEYAANDGWEYDAANQIYTLPYIIPGQREITHLPNIPKTHEDALAALSDWVHEPNPFEAQNTPNGYADADEHRTRLLNSVLHDAADQIVLLTRHTAWGEDSVTFPANPNPALFVDRDADTVAKYLLDDYLPRLLRSPLVGGIVMDSLGGWGGYYNYRREHFPYERLPLTYDDDVLRPAIFNNISQIQFAWALRELLHSKRLLLTGNATRFRADGTGSTKPLAFISYALDLVFSEGGGAQENPAHTALYRAMAAAKPLLFDTDDEVWRRPYDRLDRLQKITVLYGAHLSSGPTPKNGQWDDVSAAELAYQRRYARVLDRLGRAGWAPVTAVRTGHRAVRCERYGGRDDFYLVLHNTSADAISVQLEIDDDLIDWGRVTDVLADVDLADTRRLDLAEHDLRVLHIAESVGAPDPVLAD